jgi:hypothetical protein
MLRSTLIRGFRGRVQAGAAKHYSLVQILTANARLLGALAAATAAHAVGVLRYDTRPGDGIVHSEPLTVVLPETIDTNLIAEQSSAFISAKIEKEDAN